MRWRAIIFDLDGTLVHSAPDLHAAANRMLDDLGRPHLTLAEVTGFVGNGVPKLVERCLSATGGAPRDGGAEALRLFSAYYGRNPAALTHPYPGVPAMLETLAGAGAALGICTNKPEVPARKVLDGVGLAGLFASVVGGDTLTVKKPDGKPLLHAAAALDALPEETLYVGDSETDAATAEAAGIAFWLYLGGYRKEAPETLRHDFAFDDFTLVANRILSAAA